MSDLEMPPSKRVCTEDSVLDRLVADAISAYQLNQPEEVLEVAEDPEPLFGTIVANDEFGTWRTVPGYPDHVVIVSDKGYVRTRTSGGDGFVPPYKGAKDWNGYVRVRLTVSPTESAKHFVHTLVLRAFRGPCPPGWSGDHGLGGRADNSLANLRWATGSTQALNRKQHAPNRHARPVLVRHETWPETTPWLWFASNTTAMRACDLVNKGAFFNGSKKGYSQTRDKSGGVWLVKEAPPKESQEDLPEGMVDDVWEPAEEWRTALYREKTLDHIRVSNRGRVQCTIGKSGKWSPKCTPNLLENESYVVVGPCQHLHVAVYCSFFGPIPEDMVVDHCNGKRENNRLSNLQVLTKSDNRKKAIMRPVEAWCMPQARKVEMRPVGDESAPWKQFVSAAAAARSLGIHHALVNTHLRGPKAMMPYKGYMVRFV